MSQMSQYYASLALFWVGFYRGKCGFDLRRAFVPEPEQFLEGKWLIINDPSIAAQKLFDICDESFGACLWTSRNLDKVLDRKDSVRSAADGPYGVWVEACEEPDEELRNKSGNELKYIGVTLEERLLLEMFYWLRTGRHLDYWYRTLCSGSTYDNGGIPCVGWDTHNDRLIVDCCFLPNIAFQKLCVRKVIAAPEIPMLGAVLH